MKRIIDAFILLLTGSLAFSSCVENPFLELDKGEEELKISINKQDIILDEVAHSGDAIQLSWTSGTNFKTGNRILYTLEMDLEGNEFQSSYKAVEEQSQVYTWKQSVEEFNQLVKDKFNCSPGESVTLEAKITARVPDREEIQSDKIAFTVTTYNPVAKTLYLIGDAAPGGWAPDKAVEMQKKDIGIFTWTGNLNRGEFKFITSLGQFLPSYNRGEEEGTLFYRTSDSQPDDKFVIDEFYTYRIDVNLLKMTISVKKAEGEIPLHNQLYLVTDPSDWKFEAMWQDLLDPFLFRIGKVFPASQETGFKFGTADGQMNRMYKPAAPLAAYTEQSAVFVPDVEPEDNYWLLKEEEGGKTYKICMDIRSGKERMMMREFDPYPMLYMVGDATPNGWDLAKATPMVKDPSSPYIFRWTGTLKTGELKFSCDKQADWFGAWFMAGKPDSKPTGEVERALFIDKASDEFKGQYLVNPVGDIDYKWKIATAGTYEIVLDQLQETIVIKNN